MQKEYAYSTPNP